MMIQVIFHGDVFLHLFGGCQMNEDNAATIKRNKS